MKDEIEAMGGETWKRSQSSQSAMRYTEPRSKTTSQHVSHTPIPNGKWATARTPLQTALAEASVNHPVPFISSPVPDPLEALDFFTRRDELDKQLASLAIEKQKLTFELSRIPSTGGKSRARMTEVEEQLDDIDKKISATRKRMKDLGVM